MSLHGYMNRLMKGVSDETLAEFQQKANRVIKKVDKYLEHKERDFQRKSSRIVWRA